MRLLQFGDSVLPVGAFSFSNGLESAVQLGVVHNLDTLQAYVQTAVDQAATSDGVALLEAHRGALAEDADRVFRADRAVFQRKLNEEMRTMTVRMGRKLAELAEHVLKSSLVAAWLAAARRGQTPGTYPVAQALVFAAQGLTEHDAFAAHQYGVASMMLSAGLRLMKINYLDTQTILHQVNATAAAAYDNVVDATLDDMATFAPVMDLMAAAHIQAKVRLFMN
jgi:urease accessory protein